jgi:hypothetical protein
MATSPETGAVTGMPRLILRAEGLALGLLAVFLYGRLGESWWLFAALILVPDLTLLGYLAGPRAGAAIYNAGHSLAGPAILACLGFVLPAFILIAIALVWIAHIGADRALGLGLKYGSGFSFTHLGRIGRRS